VKLFPSALFAVFMLACAMLGCGGAPARPNADEAFARIQVHEATIAHRQAAIEACEEEPCPAADEACAAAEEICTIADALDDADARARCANARRSCPQTGGP
jgi:hypothetical protein